MNWNTYVSVYVLVNPEPLPSLTVIVAVNVISTVFVVASEKPTKVLPFWTKIYLLVKLEYELPRLVPSPASSKPVAIVVKAAPLESSISSLYEIAEMVGSEAHSSAYYIS